MPDVIFELWIVFEELFWRLADYQSLRMSALNEGCYETTKKNITMGSSEFCTAIQVGRTASRARMVINSIFGAFLWMEHRRTDLRHALTTRSLRLAFFQAWVERLLLKPHFKSCNGTSRRAVFNLIGRTQSFKRNESSSCVAVANAERSDSYRAGRAEIRSWLVALMHWWRMCRYSLREHHQCVVYSPSLGLVGFGTRY